MDFSGGKTGLYPGRLKGRPPGNLKNRQGYLTPALFKPVALIRSLPDPKGSGIGSPVFDKT